MTCKYLRDAVKPPLSFLGPLLSQTDASHPTAADLSKLCTAIWIGRGVKACHQPPANLIRERHAELPWDWTAISKHSEVLWLVDQLPSKPWDFKAICKRNEITIDFVRRHEARLCFATYMEVLSANSAISASMIESNPDLPWSWSNFSANESLDLAFYSRHLQEDINWPDIMHLSAREMLELHQKPMNWPLAWIKAQSADERLAVLMLDVSGRSNALLSDRL
jgi:hypothetical protein